MLPLHIGMPIGMLPDPIMYWDTHRDAPIVYWDGHWDAPRPHYGLGCPLGCSQTPLCTGIPIGMLPLYIGMDIGMLPDPIMDWDAHWDALRPHYVLGYP